MTNKYLYLHLAFLFLVLCFCSCKTITKVEYQDRIVDHYITKEIHDTLKEKITDSVYLEIITKGDTVFQTKYKERTLWKDRIVETHDTVWRDSIVMVYAEKTKEIKHIPTFFWICFVFSSIIITFAFAKFILWIKSRSWI